MPNLLGTNPNQVPTNGDLGKLAFMDVVDSVASNPWMDTDISDVKPSLLLDFANSKVLDPRITYTRASIGTYYDGKTNAKAEENLLKYSQDFNNTSGWAVANGCVITPNTTAAPDGTTTADTATSANGTGSASVAQNAYISAGNTYVFSFYAQAGTATTLHVGVYLSGWVTQTPAIVSGPGSVSGTGLVAVSGLQAGVWTRISLTIVAAASGAPGILIYPETSGAGTGKSVILWGAQLEQRSAASAYTPTTTTPITNYIPALQTAASGVARFDHDPLTGESKGLLIEEQRTNLLTYSEDFSNPNWAKVSINITFNTNIAPDGTLTATKFYNSPNLSQHRLSFDYQVTLSPGTYTLSVYAKRAERYILLLTLYDGVYKEASFNLDSGTIDIDGTYNASAIITPVGNGWYRCIMTGTITEDIRDYNMASGFWIDNNNFYTGDGYSGIYIWGAQLEQGSFPTSYIKTTSAQVTRAADAASMTGTNFSSWYNALNGVFYYDFADGNVASHAEYAPYDTFIGAVTNGVRNGYMDSLCYIGGWTVRSKANPTFSGYLAPQSGTYVTTTIANFKVATFATRTAMGGVANGGSYVSTAFTSAPSYPPNMLYINPALNGHLRKIAYYPVAMSATNLQALTA